MTPRQLTKKEMAEPGTPEHSRIITASKVATMMRDGDTGDYLGIGYQSAFDQWHEMNGTWSPDMSDMEEHFLYGHSVEKAARYWWLENNPGWRVSPGEVAFTDDDLPFPNQVTLDMRASKGRSRKILEVKAPRVDRGVEDKWLVQILLQMRVSGIHQAELIIWPVYGFPEVYPIEYMPDLVDAILRDADAFYQSLTAGEPPAAGDSEHAKEILGALNPDPDPEVEYEVPDDLMEQLIAKYKELGNAESSVTELQNNIAMQMGDAGKATHKGVKVASRSAGRFAQSRIPKEHKAILKDPEMMVPKFDPGKLKKTHPEIHAAATSGGSFTFERKAWEKNE